MRGGAFDCEGLAGARVVVVLLAVVMGEVEWAFARRAESGMRCLSLRAPVALWSRVRLNVIGLHHGEIEGS